MSNVTIRSSQKVFTAQEVCGLTGIDMEKLCTMARSRHMGFRVRAAEVVGDGEQWFFTNSDLMVLAILHTHQEH